MFLRRFARNLDPANLPRVTFAQRVIDKIVANALIYETETGESLIGFALRQEARPEPDLYVLDTIGPDASAVRASTYFEQGDDLQGDIFNWLYDNWESIRLRMRTINSDAPCPNGMPRCAIWAIGISIPARWSSPRGAIPPPPANTLTTVGRARRSFWSSSPRSGSARPSRAPRRVS